MEGANSTQPLHLCQRAAWAILPVNMAFHKFVAHLSAPLLYLQDHS